MSRRIAVIAPPLPSHYRVLEALAGELVERGHQLIFIQQQEAVRWLTDARFQFRAVGLLTHPLGSLARTLRYAANPGGPLGLRRLIADMSRSTDMLCRELPQALSELQIDALLCDQMEAAGGLVAEAAGLPYVSVACALPVNREPGLPLPVMPMAFAQDSRSRQIYAGSERVYDWFMTPHRRIIAQRARALGLSARDGLHQCLSPHAQISQTIAGFDFPRMALPPHFHPVGPLRARTSAGSSPDARLNGGFDAPPDKSLDQVLNPPIASDRPLVFASLGTLLGQRFPLFRRITRACRQMDVQLLLAHCGGLTTKQAQTLKAEGATWVTDFAPQQAALARADAVISHGGLNTVLDALAARTPILALPLAFDHPGIAARVVHAGVGLRASARFASHRQLSDKLQRLLKSPDFASPLEKLGRETDAAGGTVAAADIIERVVGVTSKIRQDSSHARPL